MTWTPKTSPADVRTVGVIGTGVIGGGWAAKFLAQGYDVVAWDPGPDAAERLARLHDIAWPSLERLGLAAGAARDRLRVVDSLEEAAGQADVIQESGPEVLDLKRTWRAPPPTPSGSSSAIPSTRRTSCPSSRSSAAS